MDVSNSALCTIHILICSVIIPMIPRKITDALRYPPPRCAPEGIGLETPFWVLPEGREVLYSTIRPYRETRTLKY